MRRWTHHRTPGFVPPILLLLIAVAAFAAGACAGGSSANAPASKDAGEDGPPTVETTAVEITAETADVETTGETGEPARFAESDGTPAALSVPSLWEGEMQGQVYGQAFHLPVTVQFEQPMPYENNPVHLFVGSGSFSQIGDLGLYSAQQYQVSTGLVTLQYFTVEVQGSQLKAVLTDQHVSEAAAINQFIATNVSAQNAPPGPGSQVYENLGPTELFAFHQGTELVLSFSSEQLTGSVRGLGESLTGIFPIPDVEYQAEFVAARVR